MGRSVTSAMMRTEEHSRLYGVGGGRALVLSAAREITLGKPIIVIKAGRSEAASRAAASHRGVDGKRQHPGSRVRCGVLRVQHRRPFLHGGSAEQAAAPARSPAHHRHNAGGPAVLATDALIATGGKLDYRESARAGWVSISVLEPRQSRGRARRCGRRTLRESSRGGLERSGRRRCWRSLLHKAADPADAARRIQPYALSTGKPVLASWMGGDGVAEGIAILNAAGIPTFPYSDTATRA